MKSRRPANASRHSGVTKHELEDQLRETVERYELIFKATNDVLYDLDLRKGSVIWNDALYTQFGYSEDEAADSLEWWVQHIHPDDALRLEHELSNWFEGNQDTWQAEYRFRKANGSYSYIRDRGVVQRTPDGEPLRIIGSFLDITQQKQLDKAKDEFISLVSHQLRTPLTVIRMYSEMLTAGMLGELDSKQAAHVGNITSASVRLIKLVGDILNISRLELDHITIHVEPTDVNELIQAHVNEVLPLANEKNVAIKFQADTTLKPIPIDHTVFDQIIHNLLTNAIRYSRPDKVDEATVEVSFSRNADGYLLSVTDNGIGIPKSAQTHIFNRFYRAPNATNLEEHGTGLGLYLVKLMADASGGKVWFKSRKNHGTTFFMQLPPHGMQTPDIL